MKKGGRRIEFNNKKTKNISNLMPPDNANANANDDDDDKKYFSDREKSCNVV